MQRRFLLLDRRDRTRFQFPLDLRLYAQREETKIEIRNSKPAEVPQMLEEIRQMANSKAGGGLKKVVYSHPPVG